jgi:hypothetical protein
MSGGRVELRLELPAQVSAGVPITGRLTLTNAGDDPFSGVSPLSSAALNVVVFDRLWDLVQPDAVGKVHVGHDRIELAPGETRAFGLSDLAYVSGTAGMAYSLGSGLYFVVAVYHPGSDRLPERSEYPTAVSSNVVRLEVRATR